MTRYGKWVYNDSIFRPYKDICKFELVLDHRCSLSCERAALRLSARGVLEAHWKDFHVKLCVATSQIVKPVEGRDIHLDMIQPVKQPRARVYNLNLLYHSMRAQPSRH